VPSGKSHQFKVARVLAIRHVRGLQQVQSARNHVRCRPRSALHRRPNLQSYDSCSEDRLPGAGRRLRQWLFQCPPWVGQSRPVDLHVEHVSLPPPMPLMVWPSQSGQMRSLAPSFGQFTVDLHPLDSIEARGTLQGLVSSRFMRQMCRSCTSTTTAVLAELRCKVSMPRNR
jgi:hypothetical protein